MKAYKQQFITQLGDAEVVVAIQASRRKSMRLGWSAKGEIDLRIPVGVRKSEVLSFLQRHEQWLLQRRLQWLEEKEQNRGSITLLGDKLALAPGPGRSVVRQGNTLLVPGGTEEQRSVALDKWLRQQAREQYQTMIDLWWPEFRQYNPVKPTLRIKRMKTRWGSLSTRGYINLNVDLLQQPADLVELVVVHELCHLAHFDHGPGFRALMQHHLADVKQREQRLNRVRLNGLIPTC